MPSETAHGYPYPLPTEPVAEGAQAIRNLAEAIDAGVGLHLIESVVLSAAGHVVFSAIPQTFRDLHLRLSGHGAQAVGGGLDAIALRFNDYSGNAYNSQRRWTYQTATTADEQLNAAYGHCGFCPDSSTAPSLRAALLLDILDYRGSAFKIWLGRGSAGGPSGAGRMFECQGMRWGGGADVVTKLDLWPPAAVNFAVGTVAALYGVA